jgi:hypothetical protein
VASLKVRLLSQTALFILTANVRKKSLNKYD